MCGITFDKISSRFVEWLINKYACNTYRNTENNNKGSKIITSIRILSLWTTPVTCFLHKLRNCTKNENRSINFYFEQEILYCLKNNTSNFKQFNQILIKFLFFSVRPTCEIIMKNCCYVLPNILFAFWKDTTISVFL